jgi:hypothetical protein
MEKKPYPKTVAIDFDGVIHRYSKGWQDGSAYDPPMENAKFSLSVLINAGHPVVIFSTRDPVQIQAWFETHMPEFRTQILEPHERFWNAVGIIGITRHKPAAYIYIDDRALHFQTWDLALAELRFRLQKEN